MNNAILLQHAFAGRSPEDDFAPMLELTHERNIAYCEKHGFDYDYLIGCRDPRFNDPYQGAWPKVEMIHDALQKNYQYVVWLDADTIIRDLDTDLRDGCPNGIGACWMRIPQLDHWNTGVLYLQNSQAVRNFVSEWLAQFPGHLQWKEQGVFNVMAMKSRLVQTISDRWNATLNYSMVPDAVVLGFHGNLVAPQRYELMQVVFKKLEAQNA